VFLIDGRLVLTSWWCPDELDELRTTVAIDLI